jgi:hypothetical protein
MTIKEYLEEFFSKDENPFSEIEVYRLTVKGKGEINVEYNTTTKRADIIHTDAKRFSNYYEAENGQELKDTIEFCVGPLVSDKQWNQGVGRVPVLVDDEIDAEDF